MMIFKTLFKGGWQIFDVLCYVLAAVFVNYGVFLINYKAGFIALGVTFTLTGLASELITGNKGGDN